MSSSSSVVVEEGVLPLGGLGGGTGTLTYSSVRADSPPSTGQIVQSVKQDR